VATLEVTPAACRTFAGWSDGDRSNPRQVTIHGDTSFVALFDTVVYTDTITVDTIGNFLWENHEYTESGVYTQTYTTTEGCDSILVLQLHTIPDTTGICLTKRNSIYVYPNPTSGIIHVDGDMVEQINVYDATGRLCASHSGSNETDLFANLPAGNYLMKVRLLDGTEASLRVIRQ